MSKGDIAFYAVIGIVSLGSLFAFLYVLLTVVGSFINDRWCN